MDNFITIGVTGGIGSGKSYVCRILEAMGYPVFYSDLEAKNLLQTDNELISSIKSLFGDDAYIGQELNRKLIGDQIFSDPKLREDLNAMVHPKVREAFKKFSIQSKSPLCFNEAAILFETGAHKNFDYNILVSAPENLKIERLKKRDGSTIAQIKARMDAQWSDEKKAELADYEIKNDEIGLLIPQITDIITQLESQGHS